MATRAEQVVKKETFMIRLEELMLGRENSSEIVAFLLADDEVTYTRNTIMAYMHEIRNKWKIEAQYDPIQKAEQIASVKALYAHTRRRLKSIPEDTKDLKAQGTAARLTHNLIKLETLLARLQGTWEVKVSVDVTQQARVQDRRKRVLEAARDPETRKLCEQLYERTRLIDVTPDDA
jgi:hypothetical protein